MHVGINVCMYACMSIGDGRQLDETKLDG